MSAPEISHGRGGAGNINPDDTQYQDAEIVRTGDEGTGVSTGRGGMPHSLFSTGNEEKQAEEAAICCTAAWRVPWRLIRRPLASAHILTRDFLFNRRRKHPREERSWTSIGHGTCARGGDETVHR